MKSGRFARSFAAAIFSTTLALLSACTSSPATAEAEGEDIRTELVEWARLAQNAHNVQPWRVVLDGDDPTRIALYVDTSRLLPETDPPSRQITISMGTFLAVLDARAAQLGYQADMTLFPEGEYDESAIGELPVADIRLRDLGSAGEAEARYPIAGEPDALTSASIKYRYRPADLPAESAATIEGYSTDRLEISMIDDPGEVAWLNELSVDAFALEMGFEPTMMESYELMRMNGRQRRQAPYGLALTSNFPVRTLWFIDAVQTVFPQDPEAFGESGTRYFSRAMENIEHYILMVTTDNSRTAQVETGMALQALWMDLHAANHVALPNSQALQEYPEMAELYDRIHTRYAEEGQTVQMLLAVAQPRGGRHRFGPRLPTEALIVEGGR
ncbi:MAG: hypothetical protein ACOC28_01825 [Alkalispirochaetaceae bacterium]